MQIENSSFSFSDHMSEANASYCNEVNIILYSVYKTTDHCFDFAIPQMKNFLFRYIEVHTILF